jgi:hypothetical protein
MRLTLDGRVLTAKIADVGTSRGRTLEEKLYGKRIDAICSPSFDPSRRQLVVRRRLWPTGARRVSFRFGRDISRRVKWCLIEHDAADIASVSFTKPEPIRLVGKGRGPSAAWWRLGGGTGPMGEPCVLWRIARASARWCFSQFAERRVTLGVEQSPECDGDLYLFGVVSAAAATVRLALADGTSVDANRYEAPRGSRIRPRFFAAALPEGSAVRSVQALDDAGGVLAERRVPDYSDESCG